MSLWQFFVGAAFGGHEYGFDFAVFMPTETESKAALDQYIAMVRSLVERAKSGDAESFKEAPKLTPRRRLDETLAARNPVLRWKP